MESTKEEIELMKARTELAKQRLKLMEKREQVLDKRLELFEMMKNPNIGETEKKKKQSVKLGDKNKTFTI